MRHLLEMPLGKKIAPKERGGLGFTREEKGYSIHKEPLKQRRCLPWVEAVRRPETKPSGGWVRRALECWQKCKAYRYIECRKLWISLTVCCVQVAGNINSEYQPMGNLLSTRTDQRYRGKQRGESQDTVASIRVQNDRSQTNGGNRRRQPWSVP